MAIWRAGWDKALRTISTPVFWSSFFVRSPLRCWEARNRATPPPGTMPSSTAARVACIASSTRSLRSFTSISVDPPTRIHAPPPATLARRARAAPAARDPRAAAGELGQPLLQLLAVVVGGGLLDLLADLGASALDVG